MNLGENTKFYFLNSNFRGKRTGIENSALLRARIFKRYLHVNPIIVTASYNPRLSLQRKKLYENGFIDKDIEIINLYEYFQETKSDEEKAENKWITNPDWIYKTVKGKNDFKIYDENNNLIIYRKCDDNGLLVHNIIYVEKIKLRKDSYDCIGCLSRTQYFDSATGQVNMEVYYRTDGSVCINKHFDVNGNLLFIQLFHKKGELLKTFVSESELITYWIQTLIESNDQSFFIIDRERVYFPSLLKIKQKNVFKLCMIHNAHYSKKWGRFRSNTYKLICENLSDPDAVILLTDRQKEDMMQQFELHDNLFTIPHSIEKEISRVDFENRIPLQAVCLARYSTEKQHSSLIRVFHKVAQAHPNIRLDLYGHGDEKNSMIKQIKNLGLENNIFVNTYVENIEEIYNKASMAVLSSRMEGFSLFILESIVHGCPVISYDVDYGPSDMIDDGENGYLIALDDEEEMAKKIIDLFNNKEKLKAMSLASYKKAESFQSQLIAEKWSTLIETIIQRKPEMFGGLKND